MAIGSRLRLLTDKITEDAVQVYKLYKIDLHPKWFPVFHALSQGSDFTITEIANQVGHSHPSVSKIVAEMAKKNIVTGKKDKKDGRRNVIGLSKKGKELAEQIKEQYTDVTNAVEEISRNTQHDLWKAIEEWEFLLNRKSILRYVQEQRKLREGRHVKIVEYKPVYAEAFKKLNEEWITAFFKMEDDDHKVLNDPKRYILNKGGKILVALYDNEPVGVCALLKLHDPDYDYELAKMAVAPAAQGKNIGWLLGQAIIEKAKSLGAKAIYLGSNTKLQPAINLYYKLGFTKIAGHATPYERCNFQMELKLK